MQKNRRILEIDALRGIAIVLMIIYHIFFDSDYFGLIDINLLDPFWLIFQRTVGTLFVLLVGVSLTLSESKNKEGYLRHAKRALKLAAIAVLITVATWIYPHEGFIMFGIIHFIAVATLIAPFFFRFGMWNVLLGLLIILAGFQIANIYIESEWLFWLGFIHYAYAPIDHYSLIPWFGIILIGVYAGQLFLENKEKFKSNCRYAEKLAFLGRNSLIIYLIHQPIIASIIIAYKIFL